MSMKSHRSLVLVFGLLAAGVVWAQAEDLSGLWTLEASGLLLGSQEPCTFQGTAQVTQTGSEISGTAELSLIAGPAACPAEMTAAITGVLEGDQISGNLLGGNLGEATFTGSLGAGAVAVAARAVSGVQGGYDVTQGPFAGVAGSWAALFRGGQARFAIPTLGVWTLLLLATLLLAAGAWVLRRRHLL